MKRKKNLKYDYRPQRFTFFLFGLCFALLIVLGAFRYTEYRPIEPLCDLPVYAEPPIEIIQTIHEQPKKQEAQPDLAERIIQTRVPLDPAPTPKPSPEPEPFTVEPMQVSDPVFFIEPKIEPTDDPYPSYIVSKQAEFNGDLLSFLGKNSGYPKRAKNNEIEGTVLVSFVVERDGEITNLTFENEKLGYGLEEAAMEAVRKTSGKWSPAEQMDLKVRVRMLVPVRFKLF